jgi:hypothetical protein
VCVQQILAILAEVEAATAPIGVQAPFRPTG